MLNGTNKEKQNSNGIHVIESCVFVCVCLFGVCRLPAE